MQAMQGEGQQRQGAQDLEKVADQDHQAPVVAVGNMARRQQKYQPGQKQHQPRVAQIDRPVGDLIDLPGYSHRLGFGAHDDHHPCQLIAAKVSIGKCCCTCCR